MEQYNPQHHQLDTPRGAVHYWAAGQPGQPALFFCPGLSADHRLFTQQTSYFSADYFCIAWDAPLHGLSRPYADFSYQHNADDVLAILDQEQVERAVIIGQSLGGYTAQMFALAYPQHCRAIIMVGSTPLSRSFYQGWEMALLRWTAPLMKLYPPRVLNSSIAKGATRSPHAYQNMLDMLAPYSKQELINIIAASYSSFPRLDEQQPACPTLLTHGEFDTTGFVARYNQAWAARCGLELAVIADAAHNCNDDNPAAFNAVVQRYLAELED